MPPGVINMLPGDGLAVSEVALAHPDLAGIHFTGSTPTFQHLWRTVGANLAVVPVLPADRRRDRRQGLRPRPPVRRPRRAAGRADPRRVRVPGPEVLGRLPRLRAAVGVGADARRPGRRDRGADRWATSTDLSNFMGAVIDDRAFDKHTAAIDAGQARHEPRRSLAGGTVDDSVGWFVRPTIVVGRRPDGRDVHDRVLRADPGGPRLRRRATSRRSSTRSRPRAVRPDRRDHRPGPDGDRLGPRRRCGSPPATSTSTTSPPARSSASSRSAALARRAPTTRPAPRATCCAGPPRGRSRRRFVPPTDHRYPLHGLTRACETGR